MRSSDLLPERRHTRWAALSVATTLILALVPLLFNARFYFADDTQAGAYGVWYSLGQHLRAGSLPLFEPSRWMGGNYAAEGQWGLFNPVIWLIGIAAYAVPNAVLLCTAVKFVFLAVASGGVFVLARSYGSRPEWAATAAVTLPLAGFVVYMDGASWVTGLFVWALLPWVWWGLRRTAFRSGNVLVPFAFGYVLVTVGYVHGTIMLVAVVLGVLVEAAIERAWRPFASVLGVGLLLGLVAFAVYLPGLATTGVTPRGEQGVINDNFMSPDLSGLAASSIATAHPWISGFWTPPASAPILYLSWIIPALAFIDWRRASRMLPATAGLLVVGVAALALVFGPGQIGPLRFPVRVMPYAALAALVLLTVLLSRVGVRPGRGRLVGAAAILLVGWYSALAKDPASWIPIGAAMMLALAGVLAVGALMRRGNGAGPRTALISVVLAVTAATTFLQHEAAPNSPLPDFNLPASAASYKVQLQGVTGDTFVVGSPARTYDGWRATLLSNAWYVNPTPVQNVYTVLSYRAYAEDLCMAVHGDTCPQAVAKLFQRDPTTGRDIVDLLAINNIQALMPAHTGAPTAPPADGSFGAVPPQGWFVSQRGPESVVWSRISPVANAGGVVWTSPGTRVSVQASDKRTVRLHVEASAPGGGRVAFSRLAWPGYTVDGAVLADPLRDYLLTVTVPPGSTGTDITVSFSPPGWHLEIAALAAATSLAVIWGGVSGAVTLSRRRRHRVTHVPGRGAVA